MESSKDFKLLLANPTKNFNPVEALSQRHHLYRASSESAIEFMGQIDAWLTSIKACDVNNRRH